jgi:hypothetical protein
MQRKLPDWESELIEEAVEEAERRLAHEREEAKKRALQLAREQAYHRLAAAIDLPKPKKPGKGQMSLFPTDDRLFDSDDVA